MNVGPKSNLRRKSVLSRSIGVSGLALVLAISPVTGATAQITSAIRGVDGGAQPGTAQRSAESEARMTTAASVERLGQGQRQVRASLRDLQVRQSVRLRGVQGEVGIPFGGRADEILKSGLLVLDFGYSPAMLPDLSSLTVMINDEVVRSVPLPKAGADRTRIEVPIDPALIVPGDNRLNLRLIGHYTRDCEDPLHSSLWANVSNVRSYLDLNFQRVGGAPNLQTYPAPFYDAHDIAPLRLPFVFGGAPSNGDLEAAAAMASAFGAMASYRGFSFPASVGSLPDGDSIAFLTPEHMIPELARTITGPSAAIIRHPRDPYSTVLLVMGRDAAELKQAAAGLAYAQGGLAGSYVDLSGSTAPVYGPNSAPRWLQIDRAVRLGDLAETKNLVGMGLQPGRLAASFRLAPDLFFWPAEGAKLKTTYNYPRGEWLDRKRSRLDVTVNGQYVRSLPLQTRALGFLGKNEGVTSARSTATATLPAYTLFGQNELGFTYDLQVTDPGECVGHLPNNVMSSIDPSSVLDFRGAHHAARMPNLALFTGGGFPFTRTPDLGETVVLMGDNPSPAEVEAFLNLMGQFGDSTGAAATRVAVMRTLQPSRMANKDILVIGSADLAKNSELFNKAPVRFRNQRVEVARLAPLERFFGWFTPERRDNPDAVETAVGPANGFEGVASFQSPYSKDRHVVAVLSSQPQSLPQLTNLLPTADAKAEIRGDLVVRSGTEFKAYQVMPTHWRGDLPWWLSIGYWFAQRPFMLALAALLAAVLIGFPLYYSLKAHGRRRLAGSDHE
ncbi:MAG: uncharacterized protein JWR59_921 [Brevundimonas sp.]|nr:uncharacterized protein [Brevundimonas sp.]